MGDNRRYHVTGSQLYHFSIAYVDTGLAGVHEEKIPVDECFPCIVPYEIQFLIAVGAPSVHGFENHVLIIQLIVKVLIGYGIAVDLTYTILG